jgi:DEAD/DEAH box helicase domain-containing protein
VVDPPVSGFGLYRKVPNRAYWVLNGPLRPIVAGDRTYFIRDRRSLEIVAETGGRYSDYTYGYSIELDPAENMTWLRIGLAVLCIVLRQVFGIDLSSLEYSVANTGNKKLMSIHEPRCAGLLEKMDWQKVRDSIQSFIPDEISEIMLMQIDDQAHFEFISAGANWDLAKRYAVRAVDYIMAERRIPIEISGIKISIPAPSKALKLLSIDTSLIEFEDVKILYVSVFDGEKVISGRFVRELVELVESDDEVIREIQRSLDSGFTILAYDFESIIEEIRPVSTSLYYMMLGLKGSGRVKELRERVKEIFGDPTPQDILRMLGDEKVHLKDVISEIGSSDRMLKMKGSGRWRSFTNFLDEKVRRYLQDRVSSIYKLGLFIKEIEKSSRNPEL